MSPQKKMMRAPVMQRSFGVSTLYARGSRPTCDHVNYTPRPDDLRLNRDLTLKVRIRNWLCESVTSFAYHDISLSPRGSDTIP